MSAATPSATAVPAAGGSRAGLRDLVAVELRKILATRAVWGLLAGTVLGAMLAVAGPIATASDQHLDLASAEGVRQVFGAAGAGSIFAMALGIVQTAGEFRGGLAVRTFLAEPRRGRVLVAKAFAAGVAAAAFAIVALVCCLALAGPWLAAKDAPVDIGDGTLWGVLAGTLGSTIFYGLLGTAIGFVVRNVVAALVGAITWFLVVETSIVALWPEGGRWLPGGAASSLGGSPDPEILAPGWGGLLLASWVAAALVAARLALRRRDVEV